MDNDIFFKPTDIDNQQRISIIFDQNNAGSSTVPKKSEDKIHLKTFQSDYDFQDNDSNTDGDMENLPFLTTLDNTLANQSTKNTAKFFDQNNHSTYQQNYNIQYSNEFLNSSFIANGNKTNKSSSELSFKSPSAIDTNNSLSQFHLSSSVKDILNKDLVTIEKNEKSNNETDFKDAESPKPKKFTILRNNRHLQPPAMLPKNVKRKISVNNEDKKKVNKKIKVKSLKDVIKRPLIGSGMDFFQKFHLNYSISQLTKNICETDSTLVKKQKYFKTNKNINDFDHMIHSLESDVAKYQEICKHFKDSYSN